MLKCKIFIFYVLCFAYLGASNNISRVIGGKSVTNSEFKNNNFVVAIGSFKSFQENARSKNFFIPFCTGTLLSPTWVLTAGHCLNDKQMIVYANENHLFNVTSLLGAKNVTNNKNAKLVKVRRVFYPYDFELLMGYNKLLTVQNDIALLQLQEPVNIDKYPSLGEKELLQEIILSNKKAHLLGWGKIERNKLPTVLKHTFLSVINHKTCKTSYYIRSFSRDKNDVDITINPKMLDTFSDNIICAGGYKLEGALRGSCSGDSGGGLIYNDEHNKSYVIGVLSSGAEPCGALPDKYTSVAKYLDFIRDTIKYNGAKTKIKKSILRKGYIEDLADGFHMIGTEKNIDYKSDLFESVKFLWIVKNNNLVKVNLQKGHLPKGVVINAKSGFWIKK